MMDGSGGYLLTGMMVDNGQPDCDDNVKPINQSPVKKAKMEWARYALGRLLWNILGSLSLTSTSNTDTLRVVSRDVKAGFRELDLDAIHTYTFS